MDTLSWLDIAVRLSFAFVLGSATAISNKWYHTKQLLQLNTQMAIGAAMFSILFSSTSAAELSAQVVLGISVVCLAVSWQQKNSQNINPNTIIKLWCAGAIGFTVGLGFFIPAYIGICIIILTNLLFVTPEVSYTTDFKKKLINSSKLESKIKLIPKDKPVTSQKIHYRCEVKCLPVCETDVLALLVQLGKEKTLTPTSIGSQNSLNKLAEQETEIEVNFVAERAIELLELQAISTSLKSKLKVESASWIRLPSSELASL